MSSLSYGKTPSHYEQALEDAILKLEATLNSLKLNNPRLTDKVENIKMHINNSLRAQVEFDESECENQFTIKTGGINRKMMEFVTSERHTIGIYKRCVYEIEGMQNAVEKIEKRASFQNHHKLLDLKSYTKHYERFKNDLGMLFKFDDLHGKLKREFASSRDVDGRWAWEQNLSDWNRPDYPKTPAQIEKHYRIHDE